MAIGFGITPNQQSLQAHLIRTTRIDTCNCDGAAASYQANYLDVNNNGSYDRGDSVILSDTNRDGKYDYRDAEQTSKLLNLMGNRKDPNLDGSIDWGFGLGSSDGERKEAKTLSPKLSLIDPNRDGVIGGSEVNNPCGYGKSLRLAQDLNGDGQFTGEDFAPERTQNLQFVQNGVIAGVAVPRKHTPGILPSVIKGAVGVASVPVKTLITGSNTPAYNPANNPFK